MDPISLTLGVIGLGTSLFGSFKSASDTSAYSKQQAQLSGEVTDVENQQNDLRRQAMELQGSRSQLENVRNAQMARARALAAGVSQGVKLSDSGIQGGQAQITGQEGENALGINQGLMQGRQMFGLNTQLNSLRNQQAVTQTNYQSSQATDQGIVSLGGALMKTGPMIGAMSQGFSNGLSNLNWLSQGPTGFLSHPRG